MWSCRHYAGNLSSLDGSERTFMERVRTPDANFPFLLMTLAFVLPLGFGFLMFPFAVLPNLSEAVLGHSLRLLSGITLASI